MKRDIASDFFRSPWMLAGILLHIVGLIILFLILDFDILFRLAWANGIDGPTPMMDTLAWILRLVIPGGVACYCMALWTAIRKENTTNVRTVTK